MTRYRINIKYLLICFMISIALAHFIDNVIFNVKVNTNATRCSVLFHYIDWLILAMTALLYKRIKMKYIFIMFVIVGGDFLSAYNGMKVFNMMPYPRLHVDLLVSAAIICSLGVDWSSSLNEDDVYSVINVMFLIGITACIYAMIAQNDVLRQLLRGAYAGWNYISFFGQRNKFAVVCYLAIICGFFLWLKNGRIIYPLGIALLFISIVFTDSRNSFFSTILFFGLYFAFRSRISPAIMIILAVPMLIILVSVIGVNFNDMSEVFEHKGGRGLEEESRFLMWTLGLLKISEHGAWLQGFGIHSSTAFLERIENVGSFHNIYMDQLFNSGMIGLSVHIWAMVLIYKNICKHQDLLYKNFMKAAFLSFAFYCMFEAGAMMFSTNFFSIFTSTIFAVLPQYKKES